LIGFAFFYYAPTLLEKQVLFSATSVLVCVSRVSVCLFKKMENCWKLTLQIRILRP